MTQPGGEPMHHWPTEEQPHYADSRDGGSSRWWLWLIPLGALMAAALVLAAFVIGRSSSSKPADTAAPVTSPATQTETVTTTATPATPNHPAAAHDLGLGRSLVVPACDGQIVVFLESIPVTAPNAREQVRKYIEPWEFGPLGAADYLYSSWACSSIRPVDDNGEPFYAVFVAPSGDVCARFAQVRSSLPAGAYPRRLTNSTGPGINPCG